MERPISDDHLSQIYECTNGSERARSHGRTNGVNWPRRLTHIGVQLGPTRESGFTFSMNALSADTVGQHCTPMVGLRPRRFTLKSYSCTISDLLSYCWHPTPTQAQTRCPAPACDSSNTRRKSILKGNSSIFFFPVSGEYWRASRGHHASKQGFFCQHISCHCRHCWNGICLRCNSSSTASSCAGVPLGWLLYLVFSRRHLD